MVFVVRKNRMKYGNKKVRLDGFVFDSKKESERYIELLMRQKVGEISGLKVHPVFPIVVNDQKVCSYEADFLYYVCHLDIKGSALVVEDVKGVKTQVYILKRKLMKAIRGIEIKEV